MTTGWLLLPHSIQQPLNNRLKVPQGYATVSSRREKKGDGGRGVGVAAAWGGEGTGSGGGGMQVYQDFQDTAVVVR